MGGQTRLGVATVDATTGAPTAWAPQLGTPVAGFGGAILTAPDLTVIGGARIQLADELFNGLALFVEPSAYYVLPPTNLSATITGSTITFTWACRRWAWPACSSSSRPDASGLTNIAAGLPIGTATPYTVNRRAAGHLLRAGPLGPRQRHQRANADIAVTVGGTVARRHRSRRSTSTISSTAAC